MSWLRRISRSRWYRSWLLLGIWWIVCQPGAIAQPADLPEGRTGLASRYPGDDGLADDPRVVFFESFEADSIRDVADRWESVENREALSLAADIPEGSSGGQSLLVTHVGGRSTGAHLYRRLLPGYERLHYRFYVKFDADCAPIHHFFHVGGYNPPTAWPQGGAGVRPEGDRRFTTGVEPFGENWQWDYYSYWMNMRGSPPRGQCWGNSFIHDPQLKVPREQWICVELLMQLNDGGDSNGEMALWIDGVLASHLRKGAPKGKWVFDKFLPGQGGEGVTWNDSTGDRQVLDFPAEGAPFEGFQWRNDESLNLNFLWLLCYITRAADGQVSRIGFDNIVVAQDYIGPIERLPSSSAKP